MKITFTTLDEGATVKIESPNRRTAVIGFSELDEALQKIADELGAWFRNQHGAGRIGKRALDIGDIQIVDEKGRALTEWKKPTP